MRKDEVLYFEEVLYLLLLEDCRGLTDESRENDDKNIK